MKSENGGGTDCTTRCRFVDQIQSVLVRHVVPLTTRQCVLQQDM